MEIKTYYDDNEHCWIASCKEFPEAEGDGASSESAEASLRVDCENIKNERVRLLLTRLLLKVNKVTSYHRHGSKIPVRNLDSLSDFQVDVENTLKGL